MKVQNVHFWDLTNMNFFEDPTQIESLIRVKAYYGES